MARKLKFYDIRHLMKKHPNAQYYMAIGERSNGKTYSALDYCLENYFKTGEQFAYLRRFNEDIKKKNLSQLFAAHCENGTISKYSGGLLNTVDYTAGKFRLGLALPDGTPPQYASEYIGHAFDLNSMEHYKSISFPKITTIVFDEFLSRQGYLPKEFILFTNALSTIIRQRNNVKIIMLGNTVNQYCPYFAEMGLTHIKSQKQGTVDVYHYGNTGLEVVVEYCSPLNKEGKDSDVYFAFENPELQMITTGAWEIAVYPHLEIKYRPKDVQFEMFFIFDDNILHGELVATDNTYFLHIHRKTTPIKNPDTDIIYADKPDQRWNWKMCLTKQTDKVSLTVVKMFKENRVFYSDNEVGEIMRNYLIWSDNYSIKR